jgi:hypothetical protein
VYYSYQIIAYVYKDGYQDAGAELWVSSIAFHQ